MTTARTRPALRLATESGVDLAVAIDVFLSPRPRGDDPGEAPPPTRRALHPQLATRAM